MTRRNNYLIIWLSFGSSLAAKYAVHKSARECRAIADIHGEEDIQSECASRPGGGEDDANVFEIPFPRSKGLIALGGANSSKHSRF